MSEVQSFLGGQIDCLRHSIRSLNVACEDLPLNPRLAGRLTELSSDLPAPPRQSPPAFGPGYALEILSQARASLDLLEKYGHLPRQDGDGPASRLRSALDDLERELGKELRAGLTARVYGLYVIIDPEITGGRDPLEVARGALRGGARMVQLRDKLREKGQTLPLARALKELCAEYDALLILNDHADLAAAVGADGLHIGQGDLPLAEVRRILNPRQIAGRSNHLLEEALESQAQGADHVALGSVYPTTTKTSIRQRATVGPEAIRRVKAAVDVPVVAIGGINEENVEPVARAGADAICVTGAVGLAKDPEEASRRLVEKILEAGGRA